MEYKLTVASVIKESYGADKQQHTFTLMIDGERRLIKGRNLYRVGCWRKKWANEEERKTVAVEKHERGSYARNVELNQQF